MTDLTAAPGPATAPPTTGKVAVVIPIPNDPDWALFDHVPDDVDILVCDDSDGKLAPPPRDNVTYYDYAAQREVMGEHYGAIPHKSAAARNFGHVLAYREGYDTVVALDYDCRTAPGWLPGHLSVLGRAVDAPALEAGWINTITTPGFYARGFPYEYRCAESAAVRETTASGDVKLNMGVWSGVLDLNGVDKLAAEPGTDPGVRDGDNRVALGMIPLCGMNTAFTADLIPAFFFLPDVWVDGWQLSRHDDIWGGYVLQRLMAINGDLVRFGNPVVEHTRQTRLERVVVLEQWMHLMSLSFYDCVDAAAEGVVAGDYSQMFGDFTERFLSRVSSSKAPPHYRAVFRELGESMARWAACFG